jgi:hypothetical protein
MAAARVADVAASAPPAISDAPEERAAG